MARMNERGSLQLLLPAGSCVSAVIFARDEQNTFSFRTTLFLPRNPVSYFYSGGKKNVLIGTGKTWHRQTGQATLTNIFNLLVVFSLKIKDYTEADEHLEETGLLKAAS